MQLLSDNQLNEVVNYIINSLMNQQVNNELQKRGYKLIPNKFSKLKEKLASVGFSVIKTEEYNELIKLKNESIIEKKIEEKTCNQILPWESFLSIVKNENMDLYSLIYNVKIKEFTNEKVILVFSEKIKYQFNKLNEDLTSFKELVFKILSCYPEVKLELNTDGFENKEEHLLFNIKN